MIKKFKNLRENARKNNEMQKTAKKNCKRGPIFAIIVWNHEENTSFKKSENLKIAKKFRKCPKTHWRKIGKNHENFFLENIRKFFKKPHFREIEKKHKNAQHLNFRLHSSPGWAHCRFVSKRVLLWAALSCTESCPQWPPCNCWKRWSVKHTQNQRTALSETHTLKVPHPLRGCPLSPPLGAEGFEQGVA